MKTSQLVELNMMEDLNLKIVNLANEGCWTETGALEERVAFCGKKGRVEESGPNWRPTEASFATRWISASSRAPNGRQTGASFANRSSGLLSQYSGNSVLLFTVKNHKRMGSIPIGAGSVVEHVSFFSFVHFFGDRETTFSWIRPSSIALMILVYHPSERCLCGSFDVDRQGLYACSAVCTLYSSDSCRYHRSLRTRAFIANGRRHGYAIETANIVDVL